MTNAGIPGGVISSPERHRLHQAHTEAQHRPIYSAPTLGAHITASDVVRVLTSTQRGPGMIAVCCAAPSTQVYVRE